MSIEAELIDKRVVISSSSVFAFFFKNKFKTKITRGRKVDTDTSKKNLFFMNFLLFQNITGRYSHFTIIQKSNSILLINIVIIFYNWIG